MAKCEECTYFFPISSDSEGTEPGKGDCVIEEKDEKGKFWKAKEVSAEGEACAGFQKR